MSETTVLLVGGTGRTGGRALAQLLDRDVNVRAIVRSAERLPEGAAGSPGLTVVEADLLSTSDAELAEHVRGCDAIVSCLGHNISLGGVFGKPRDLVTQAVRRLCAAAQASSPNAPVRFVLMSSVSVNRPGRADARRGTLERMFLGVLRALVPPARDNQHAADFLLREVGADNGAIEWAVVRPDTLIEGDVTEYEVHDELVASLFKADETNMANVAHFMCELVTDDDTWARWSGKVPVITNA